MKSKTINCPECDRLLISRHEAEEHMRRVHGWKPQDMREIWDSFPVEEKKY